MTKEEIMEMTLEQLEERTSEIKSLVESKDETVDFEALSMELDSIKERKSFLADEERKADTQAVIDGAGEETNIELPKEERKVADLKEIRNSAAYVDAFAEYVKTGDESECRALLSELATAATGYVPVPEFVEDEIKTAWSSNRILERVKKSYLKGIIKIGFELSATGAVVHSEGDTAPAEETLTLGIVELKPESIKKWITISDEVMDLKGEAFLRYIYDELTYQIAKKAEEELIALIEAAGTVSTASAVGVPVVATSATLSTVAEAISALSDKAADPVVIMNKASYASFKALQYAGNFPVDPFEGLDVIFNNSIKAVSAASSGDTYMIVGDLGVGAQANFPNGDEITLKFDDLSLAEADLVKIVGREYVALGIVAPDAFVKVQAV